MVNQPSSQRIRRLMGSLAPVHRFFTQSTFAKRAGDPTVSNFAVGNPHDMPLPAFVEALQQWATPQHKDWFAYVTSEPAARAAVVEALRARRGVDYDPADIHLTNGAFAALAVTL